MRRLGFVFAIAAACAIGNAEPSFLQVVKAKYGVGTCQTCHVAPPVRNVFGKQVEAQLTARGLKRVDDSTLTSLESGDADGDGFSNGDELRAGSSPGDPKSVPGKVGTVKQALAFPKHAFHPLIVHFPIALFIFGAFLEVLGARRGDASLRRLASWNLGFGAGASLIAVGTGITALNLLGLTLHGIQLYHLVCASSACLLMIATMVLKVKRRDTAGIYWMLLCLATIMVAVAGHLGATLVFG